MRTPLVCLWFQWVRCSRVFLSVSRCSLDSLVHRSLNRQLLRTSWMASAFLSLACDGDNGPPVSNDDRVFVELKSLARITHLVFRVFRIAFKLLMVTFVSSKEFGKLAEISQICCPSQLMQEAATLLL
jgi:hypothetical protein